MNKYVIELSEDINVIINELSRRKNQPVEEIIQQILSRFLLPLHTMDSEEMGKAYAEMGQINLDIANL